MDSSKWGIFGKFSAFSGSLQSIQSINNNANLIPSNIIETEEKQENNQAQIENEDNQPKWKNPRDPI